MYDALKAARNLYRLIMFVSVLMLIVILKQTVDMQPMTDKHRSPLYQLSEIQKEVQDFRPKLERVYNQHFARHESLTTYIKSEFPTVDKVTFALPKRLPAGFWDFGVNSPVSIAELYKQSRLAAKMSLLVGDPRIDFLKQPIAAFKKTMPQQELSLAKEAQLIFESDIFSTEAEIPVHQVSVKLRLLGHSENKKSSLIEAHSWTASSDQVYAKVFPINAPRMDLFQDENAAIQQHWDVVSGFDYLSTHAYFSRLREQELEAFNKKQLYSLFGLQIPDYLISIVGPMSIAGMFFLLYATVNHIYLHRESDESAVKTFPFALTMGSPLTRYVAIAFLPATPLISFLALYTADSHLGAAAVSGLGFIGVMSTLIIIVCSVFIIRRSAMISGDYERFMKKA